MKLSDLISNLQYEEKLNFEDVEIRGVSYNSKTTKQGDIFVCLVGEHSDGHQYFKNAQENGSSAFLTEKELDTKLPQIIVDSTRQKIADIADKFYDSPSKKLNLIGITGTNGKTTVTHLIQKIFEENKQQCALIGTLGYKLTSESEYKEAKHTTPQAPELQFTLDLIADKMKIPNCVMEVSSHALEQNRVGGCVFKGAVLTNLTQDHLDYHITMDNYFESKAILFKEVGEFAVINVDDLYAKRFLEVIPEGVKILTYGIENSADIMAKDIEFSPKGAEFALEGGKFGAQNVCLQMNGMFSVYNVLAAITTGLASGFELKSCINPLEQTQGVAGRFEVVAQNPLVIVDYAHTPDGLENVLKAAKEITPKGSELICLFGCGGDRDATKRPKMGAIAEALSDKVVITSDNPRSEEPQQIITDILAGLRSVTSEKVFVEADRGRAIALLKTICKNNDVIVIAGKGHEDYQILKDKTIHFDDREEARKIFNV
ncbi:MAG TPA: UDP-N-acetylmuramoyl-L-alanyl-D-glutamate--2,6-diaminopimelate ligase [Candidatus Gastranaerophilaceae bacterium]|nr:UDP-N-acetylmuramoyl-L-alanyl-D-glutamate--2,6-diaminopimelate ligase [Candidatus Gastranaerophilaceae bacterium]HPT40811.1 UDP-N-acetylmuramoyl-L-alanyl-D-glutamate--2,6-diaminopimelate ligase [Candidatus Gastranaerophilaceae bacterium]